MAFIKVVPQWLESKTAPHLPASTSCLPVLEVDLLVHPACCTALPAHIAMVALDQNQGHLLGF
jgi:hypothetical protein